MAELASVCSLCDVLVTSQTVRDHYEQTHPHLRSPEDWEFACWPDGEQMLVPIDPDITEFL